MTSTGLENKIDQQFAPQEGRKTDMATIDLNGGEPIITTQPSPTPTITEPRRRVSIATDPVSDRLHEGYGYEQNRNRKISSQSEHSEAGPVRKKSILVNAHQTAEREREQREREREQNRDRERTYHHDGESQHSIPSHGMNDYNKLDHKFNGDLHTRHFIQQQQAQQAFNQTGQLEQSWIYALCMRCRMEDNSPSWEPSYWQKCCPYPLCPSFRQFARLISLIIIGIVAWVTVYVILGDTAAPGGQLFGLVVLTVAANFGGFLISLTTLPRLIGMLLVGILFQNVGWVDLGGEFQMVTAELRKFALTIILIRAGLEMDPEAFKKVYVTILKLGLVPWTVECSVVALLTHYFLDLPWIWAWALGSIIAAVSPAVVVPCLYRLRTKGYGVAKGIPTLIIAVAGIDDAASVAGFGIIASIMFGTGSVTYQISQAPVCIIGGLAFGVVWGYFARYIPEKGDAYVVPLRTLVLFGGGLLAIFGSETIGFEGAGPLGVVFAAFCSNYFWCKQGWSVEDNPVSTAFEIFWMIFEPILFGVTGASIKIRELDPNVVQIGAAILSAGVILRILATIAIAFGDKLNLKEKIFVSLSWMAKATVQAALGPVCLRKLSHIEDATDEQKHYADIVMMICIFSIVLTAPIGAILISISGPRLLTKTKTLPPTEGWRRSHRPSLYDISIIDEKEEREDPEMQPDEKTTENTQSNAHLPPPVYTITK